MFNLLELEQFLPGDMSPAYKKQLEVVDIYYNKISKAFPSKFMDDFWREGVKLNTIDCEEQFTAGLRLGAQLTLALLQPLPKTPRP